jgi:two-component system nitrogen regulation response regulator GlnG
MPTLLVVDDDRSALHMFLCAFQGTEVVVETAQSAAEGLQAFERLHPDAVVLDIVLPDQSGIELVARLHAIDSRVPVIFVTALGGAETAIEAMKLGAFDYLIKPLDLMKIRELLLRAFEIRRLAKVPVKMAAPLEESGPALDLLIGNCSAMQDVYKAIGRVAPQAVNVLIRGESGTGKELVARAIYQHGPRAEKRFLAVNCAAIPEPLLESELFGHERGAFTGAEQRRIGKFEQAHGGTLFLDEVGDMTPLMQSKVLRALQEQRFERVGGTQTIQTDALIIAATNRDLEQMVADGQFRADLYYRLNTYTISLPPLRERASDIPLLVEHYLQRFNRELGKTVIDVSTDALELLLRYSWPGNVRELQSVLKQSLLHATGDVLLPTFLPSRVRGSRRPAPEVPGDQTPRAGPLESFIDNELAGGGDELYAKSLAFMERTLLARVLRHTGGNQSRAAKLLGITRGSLRNKIRLLRISINPAVSVEDDPRSSEA